MHLVFVMSGQVIEGDREPVRVGTVDDLARCFRRLTAPPIAHGWQSRDRGETFLELLGLGSREVGPQPEEHCVNQHETPFAGRGTRHSTGRRRTHVVATGPRSPTGTAPNQAWRATEARYMPQATMPRSLLASSKTLRAP